jgi:CRP/FNR family cyclic AMP-dependent transcriptional regulator
MVTTRTIKDLIAEHALLAHLPAADHDLIAGCGQNVHLPAGRFLFREGEAADTFFLVRDGRVAIEVSTPAGRSLVVATTGPGGLVGWSWLFPPYRWHLDARAMDDVSAVAIDGACLRAKCEADNGLGYRLMQCFAQLAIDHLMGARRQLLDVYGDHAS